MKKRLIIFFITALLMTLTYKTLLTPHLIPTTNRILDKIVKQEAAKDCTCWSTVRIMEFHQAKLPLSYDAMAIKIEVMKTLLWEIWFSASQQDQPFNKAIEEIIGQENKKWLSSITPPKTPLTQQIQDQKYLYHQLTEHYRYLLSIIYDIAKENIDPKQLNELNHDDIQRMALLSSHLNTEILLNASELALHNRHPQIFSDDIKKAYQSIRKKLNLSNQNMTKKQTSFIFLFNLKKVSKKIIKNKMEALSKFNYTIWNDAISVKEQARLLSQIYQFNISESELQILIRFIQNESINLFYPTTPLRPDNVEKLKRSKSIMNKENLEYKIVSFQDEYNYLQETFPFKLLKNGDVEYKLATHNDGDSFYLNLKENQTIQTHTLRSFQLDSIRDTIIHWGIIDSMYRHQQVSILDPFALELIAERLSEYLGILLEVTRINSKSVANEFSTFSRYRFIQNNELKTIWENENPLLPKAYFKKSNNFETPIIKQQISIGYFSGISTVDINNDERIDIIIPEHKKLSIYLNNSNGFTHQQIKINATTPIEGVYAIDFTNDYNLDLIVFTLEDVIFLEQTKTFKFKINQSIKLNRPFSLCTNDIDNDGDIDFYITQIYHEEHPALGGRNGEKNKLVLNNNGSFNPTNIPSIESTGIGLACSILDINQDGKKDIIVINDFGKDELFIQTNNLKFKNKAREFNFDDSGAGMNLSIIDFNDDPFWDIYVTMIDMFNKHLSFQLPDENSSLNRSKKILNTSTYLIGNQLYIGRPKKFERKTQNIFEPGLKGWGWGASFFDYDNDSFDDVYITNGRILYNENYTDEKNIFMINLNNKLYFSKSTSPESSAQNSRGVSAADFENKGNLDLIVRNPANAILYKNINKNTNNWIKIKLIGNKKNTFAIGATIEVTTKEKSKRKIILAETGFRSQEPYQKHFGLGSSEIESITVTWPNNLKTKLRKPIKTNQLITLTHPEMKPN